MQFPNYVGPQFSDNDLEKNNWIPINAKSIYCDKIGATITQYALRLAYAITTQKIQGDTVVSGVIDLRSLRKKFRNYVCSSFEKFKK